MGVQQLSLMDQVPDPVQKQPEQTSSITKKIAHISQPQKDYELCVRDSTLLTKLPKSELEICRIFQDCKKLRDFSNVDYSNLAFTLLRKCAELGMEKPPLAMEVINWTVFLGKNYKGLALEDIGKAIELSLRGELYIVRNDNYIPVSVRDWNWKPLVVLCEVLNAYLEYQREKMKNFHRELNKKIEEVESKRREEANFRSYVNEWKKTILEAWRIYDDSGCFELPDPFLSFFGKLYRSGLIELTQQQIDDIREVAEMCVDPEELKKESSDIYGLKKKLNLNVDQQEQLIRQRCAEMCVEEQFRIWREKKEDVKQIIKNLEFKLEE